MKNNKDIVVSKNFVSMVTGFVLGFLVAFMICWNTIAYLVKVVFEI